MSLKNCLNLYYIAIVLKILVKERDLALISEEYDSFDFSQVTKQILFLSQVTKQIVSIKAYLLVIVVHLFQ